MPGRHVVAGLDGGTDTQASASSLRQCGFIHRTYRMTPNIAGLLFAVVGFIVTFAAARALAKWVKRRRSNKAEQYAEKTQSRQVRRAKERSGKRPS